jgi:putative FmdB family regulatory protein
MPVLDTLKEMLESQDQSYDYRCTNCDAQFESPRADMSKVSCPECSAARIRSAAPKLGR